jgi:hypothetical protein
MNTFGPPPPRIGRPSVVAAVDECLPPFAEEWGEYAGAIMIQRSAHVAGKTQSPLSDLLSSHFPNIN